jgi:hypothetical protein
MRSNPVLLTILCAALAATACRGGGGGDDDGADDDGATPDGAVDPEDATLYQIQQGEVALGTIVNVRGVIITHIDTYGMRRGEDAWVQEPDGGPWSGMLVYHIDTSVLSDLVPGDIIDIEGAEVVEFAYNDTSGRTVTELSPPQGGALTVTKTGSTDVPAPAVVDALAIGQMTDEAAREAAWEQWESVLVTVNNVTALSELDQIGSTPQDPPFEEFRVTGPLNIDTGLSSIDTITRDECLASVTGIFNYFYDYKVLPRSTADIVHGGTGCPAEEADATVCVDAVDNDANGFADCDDNNCGAFAQCETSITAIQMGDDSGNVALNGVVITGFSKDRKHLYVADAAAAASYNSIYVYRGSGVEALGVEYVIGGIVDIIGHVSEFDTAPQGETPVGDTLTELNAWGAGESVTLTAGAPQVPTPVADQTAPTLTSIANGEAYESVLVQLAGGWSVTAVDSGDRVFLTNGTDTIVMDDEAFDYGIDGTEPYDATKIHPGLCYTSVTGVMGLNLYDDERRIYPRQDLDLVLDADGSDCQP